MQPFSTTRYCSELGASRAYATDRLAAWRFGSEGTLLVLNAPYDKGVANAGNGTMVALKVTDIQTVDLLHALALRLGAIDEGAPGPRGKGFYGAYFRDPDGTTERPSRQFATASRGSRDCSSAPCSRQRLFAKASSDGDLQQLAIESAKPAGVDARCLLANCSPCRCSLAVRAAAA